MSPAEVSVSEMETAIGGLGHLARRLNQLHARLWQELVHDEVTGPQFTVLGLLHLHGQLDQGTLGQLAHLDKSTTAPLIERLVRRNLVTAEPDPADRRRKVVGITGAGAELVRTLTPKVNEVSARMLAPLDQGVDGSFVSELRAVVETSRD